MAPGALMRLAGIEPAERSRQICSPGRPVPDSYATRETRLVACFPVSAARSETGTAHGVESTVVIHRLRWLPVDRRERRDERQAEGGRPGVLRPGLESGRPVGHR